MAITKVTTSMKTAPTSAEVTAHVVATDTTGIEDDIALLGFRVASNGSFAKYNLVDQTIDGFEDTSGVDASASTNEIRNSSNYYSGVVEGAYTIDAYTSVATFTKTFAAGTIEAEILVVAGGGGGGGQYYAGAGGAGGIVWDADYAVVAGVEYDGAVGAGGTGGNPSYIGANGGNSIWNTNAEGSGLLFTANGGGGGNDSSGVGAAGGSGGGAGANSTPGASNQSSFSGATSYGNAGGTTNPSEGGGGGGASAAGGAGGVSSRGGQGGAGQLFSSFVAYGTDSSNVASTGSNGGYFGGGGGGAGGTSYGPIYYGYAGVGGGGIGGSYAGGAPTAPSSAIDGTGGGGGGSSWNTGTVGGDGGNGIVLIRSRPHSFNNMTLIANSTTAQDGAPTKGDLVMTYTDGIGTTTVNTDLKAYVSRDNGTTYTQGTLVSQGTTGGHTILTFHDLDISGQPSGTAMRYKIETLNQSVSKATRIQAVSLGWS